MQKVDPFIPVKKPRQPFPKQRPRARTATAQAVDGFMSGPQVMRQQPLQPVRQSRVPSRPAQPQNPAVSRTYTPPQPSPSSEGFNRAEQQMTAQPPRRSGLRKTFAMLLQAVILLTLFGLGFLLRSVIVGQVIIILYAIFALIFRVESRTTFIFVLISFGVVLTASLRSDTALASVFAVYAFLLLIVGTISLGREVRQEI